MFDFDAGKLLIVGVIALIFIPPKDLPRVLREVGQFVGRMRRMASDFQGQFMDAMREADMADVRREAQKLADSARVDIGFDSIHDLDRQMVAKRPADPESTSGGDHSRLEAREHDVTTRESDTLHPDRSTSQPSTSQASTSQASTSQAEAAAPAPSHPS